VDHLGHGACSRHRAGRRWIIDTATTATDAAADTVAVVAMVTIRSVLAVSRRSHVMSDAFWK